MMTTVSFRIDRDLALQAERVAKQLEYWAKLGKVISSKLYIADAYAVSQGLKTVISEYYNG